RGGSRRGRPGIPRGAGAHARYARDPSQPRGPRFGRLRRLGARRGGSARGTPPPTRLAGRSGDARRDPGAPRPMDGGGGGLAASAHGRSGQRRGSPEIGARPGAASVTLAIGWGSLARNVPLSGPRTV